jgi:acyl carrier protein
MSSMVKERNGAKVDDKAFEEAVIAIVREAIEIEPGRKVARETSFMGDLDMDSLSLVRIDTLLQAKLGLALSADDIETIATVGDLIDALRLRGQPVMPD